MKSFLKKLTLHLLFIFSCSNIYSQTSTFLISGTVKDVTTNELLFGASVMAKPGVGAVTDIDGKFSFKIEPGTYTLKVNYVGYSSKTMKVTVVDKDVEVNVILESQILDEVEVTANIATVRETPVAITNVSQQKIQEELAGRDLPMILNSTPGVYATQQGGGSGDARITLRGFDQTNIAVMVDGVPVNDMENGAVYWSNWDGLSEITKTMQVQRGLGATKLAVSSAGGTMNIITNSIEQKRQVVIKQDLGNNNYHRTSFGYNTGLVKNKYGMILAGSYRQGDGIIQGTFSQAWSYFVKFQWRVNSRHLLSLSANGAPQNHGQRNSKTTIGVYSQDFAKHVGIEDPEKNMLASGLVNTTIGERPRDYNYEVAKLNGNDFYVSTNYYHKPLINFSHFWAPTEKLTVSTVAYASLGNGGGTTLQNDLPYDKNTGYSDLTGTYNANLNYVPTGSVKLYYGDEKRSSNILRSAVNSHRWYGLLSTAIYKINKPLTLTFGIDARYYRGLHYRQIDNLLGGDYYKDVSDLNAVRGVYNPFDPTYVDPNYKNEMKRVGDKIGYNYDGLVNWGGLFSQLEFKKDAWTAFLTLTGSYTGYQRVDYFARKDVTVGSETKGFNKFLDYFKDNRDDKIFESVIGFNETLLVNGSSKQSDASSFIVYNNTSQTTFTHGDTTFVVKYNTNTTVPKDTSFIVGSKAYTIDSKEAKNARTRKQWFPGFTLKGGVNYKINSAFNVYVNAGILSIAPKFNNIYNGNAVGNRVFQDAENQQIISQEVGLGMKFKQIAANINVYYSIWNNKPVPTITQGDVTYNVNGINASHAGIEVDWVYKVIKQIEWDGTISIADWKYTNGRTVYVSDLNTGQIIDTVKFNATNVRVGNAAQFQLSNALKFMYKGFYFKPRYTYFGRNYSNFNATDLQGVNENKQSWKMPNYGLLDLGFGYEFKIDAYKINLNANVTNALNTFYISDAQNNGYGPQTFDANAASVFVGMGRQFVMSMKLTF